jgi:polyisoprenoid-binding protein YceI
MSTLYKWHPNQSQFAVQAFAAGMLSFFGHSPTFVIRTYTGLLLSQGDKGTDLRVEVSIATDSLELQDQVRSADRAEIEGRMKREVLQTANWPEITFRSTEISTGVIGEGRLRVGAAGLLTLRGTTRPHQLEAELLVFEDRIRVRGSSLVRMSTYGIAPVSALGGAIRLKDDVKVSFDLTAYPERP